VGDAGNRRVLAWDGLPEPGEPPALVLGQPDGHRGGEDRGGPVGPRSFRWPHAISGTAGAVFVVDAGNHRRVLDWSPSPTGDRDAGLVLGQPDFTSAWELLHIRQGPSRLRFPYSVTFGGDLLAVSDTANNRVLLWCGVPEGAGRPSP